MSRHRVFLLSPASCAGERARLLLSPRADFPLARRLRTPAGAPLGEAMAFLSGLYFRGKLAYARAFQAPPPGVDGVLVITAGAGLRPPEAAVTVADLHAAAAVPIRLDNPAYRAPLEADARALARRLRGADQVVLLGSIASDKYLSVLAAVFRTRLTFPATFAGRGDMSRGALLLRAAAAGRELDYVPARLGARHGPRPPRLAAVSGPPGAGAPAGVSGASRPTAP
jgi:hypothetical protein